MHSHACSPRLLEDPDHDLVKHSPLSLNELANDFMLCLIQRDRTLFEVGAGPCMLIHMWGHRTHSVNGSLI